MAGALATVGPILTRIARGGGRIASLAATGAKFVPTGKAVALSTTAALGAIRIGASSRVGTRELQVLASYLVARLRARGLFVDRGFVEHVTIQAYLRPEAAVRPHPRARPGYTGTGQGVERQGLQAAARRQAPRRQPQAGDRHRAPRPGAPLRSLAGDPARGPDGLERGALAGPPVPPRGPL